MSTKYILWIDDDYTKFTGLEAYLYEIPSVDLTSANSMEEAKLILANSAIDLLLFDMVLMKDSLHATLGRRTGMSLVHRALDRGVRLFVAYTVLAKVEVMSSWEKLLSVIDIDAAPKFEYFSKNTSSVTAVVDAVRRLLQEEA